jgi:hypothetical protein
LKERKRFTTEFESSDACEAEDEGFIEGELNIGKAIATFNFGGSIEKPKPVLAKPAASPLTPGVHLFNPAQKGTGLTPTIDGEAFSIKRGYQFRPSTLRKLFELKSKHPDVNTYLNTILDEAINHYYNYIINEKNS